MKGSIKSRFPHNRDKKGIASNPTKIRLDKLKEKWAAQEKKLKVMAPNPDKVKELKPKKVTIVKVSAVVARKRKAKRTLHLKAYQYYLKLIANNFNSTEVVNIVGNKFGLSAIQVNNILTEGLKEKWHLKTN